MNIFEKKKPVMPHVCTHIKPATDGEEFSSPWDRLAAEIVMGAIRDWRELVKSKAWLNKGASARQHIIVSFDEIRSFFRSQYCAFIMQNFSMSPENILTLLEHELQQAMEKDNWKEEKT